MVQVLLFPSLNLDVLDVIVVNVGNRVFANCVVVIFIDVLITYDPEAPASQAAVSFWSSLELLWYA